LDMIDLAGEGEHSFVFAVLAKEGVLARVSL
jgi:hypothetical protein